MSQAAKLLEVKGVFKEFDGNVVLKGVDLELESGELLALVGGNGAGKSTLMKILTGLYTPDRGLYRIKGKDVRFTSPADAHRHGIYLIPQEPLIFPNMTIRENFTIGFSGKKVEDQQIKSIMRELNWSASLDELGKNLSIAQMQLVEIVRGLIREAEILIFDEPTSTLTYGEISALFETVTQIKGRGTGIIYITHRLHEVFELANRVAVLRDGVISKYGAIKEFTYNTLLEGLIPGVTSTETYTLSDDTNETSEELTRTEEQPVLVISGLCGKRFQDISFELRAGEILGVAGVVGSGRTEIAEAIAGIDYATAGEILLGGKPIQQHSIRRRMREGIAYVPEDRHLHGMFAAGDISMNATSVVLGQLTSMFLPMKKEREISRKQIKMLRVKCTSELQVVQSLSGGNQQKIVLGKYLETKPRVLILDEPTRGIDANARDDIYRTITRLKNDGVALVIISSDMEEITLLSDRVAVIHEGQIHTVLNRDEITMDNLTSASFGITEGV